MSLRAGTRLGPYEILAPLGAGGMGEVYRARDTRLNRDVALKVLLPTFAGDPDRLRRFQREAEMASALSHPHIVTVHDTGEFEQRYYLVTEYVAGGTLRDWAKAEQRGWREIVELMVGVADGLATAHEANILHRDIKPANILVSRQGYAKLADFGLAKLVERDAPAIGEDAPTATAETTRPGMIVGTVAYMSPEQASGQPVDVRSDVFSFGVVLYELIAGQRPFAGKTDLEILQKIIHGVPEPLRNDLPAGLCVALEKTLAKDPAERYQSMREMVADLKRRARQSDSLPLAPKAQKHRAHAASKLRWAWAALAPLVVVVGLYVWRTWRTPESTEPLQTVPLTSLQGSQRYPTFSPDGNYVAFTWTGVKQDNPDIYVHQIGSSGTPLRVTADPGNDYNPVWSPDGRWIAFLRRATERGTDEVRLIPPLGGPERKLAEIHVRAGDLNSPPFLSWCPDATCVVATDSLGEGKADGLFVISFETGEKRPLTNPQPPANCDTEPAISPDGSWLVFRRTGGGVFDGELYRLRLGKGVTAAGAPQRLTPSSMDAQYPAWMPDSKQILFSTMAGGLWRMNISESRAGAPERLPFLGEGAQMPVVSRPRAGQPPRLVYVRSLSDDNVGRIDITAAGAPASSPPVVSPMSSTRDDGMVHLSADGRQAAFWSVRSGFSEIWVADLDGGSAHQITSVKGVFATGAPRWSPDGRWITYHSHDVWVIPSAGGKARNLTSSPLLNAFPSFSRDGQWIYFASNRDTHTQHQIFKMPASGGMPTRLTTGFGYVPVESMDGKYLYYVESLDKPSPLWRIPVSGGEAVKVVNGVLLGNYDVIARGIYYIDTPMGGSGHYQDGQAAETRLEYYDLATHRSTEVARNLGRVGDGLTATPDGRTILYSRVDASVDDLILVENFR